MHATTKRPGNKVARLLGLTAGCLLAVALLLSGRVPAGATDPGAHVSLGSSPVGELTATPRSGLLARRQLRPGARTARDVAVLLNPTPTTLVIRPVLRGGRGSLARHVRLDLRVRGKRIFGGRLSGLRRGGQAFTVPPGRTRVAMRARLLPGARGYRARVVRGTISWRARAR